MNLPEPPQELKDKSDALVALLKERIKAWGPISFAEYMHTALYEPGHGYYVAGQTIFGPAGDFQTAPMLGSVFGECIAEQCLEVWASLFTEASATTSATTAANTAQRSIPSGVFEFGAGQGDLAAVLYSRLRQRCIEQKLPLPDYHILEPSAALRESQQARLQQFGECIHWHTQIPETFAGIVIANEVLDAMPVERFRYKRAEQTESPEQVSRTRFQRQFVDLDENSNFCSIYVDCDERFEAVLQQGCGDLANTWPDGFTFEWNTHVGGWLGALGDCLSQGAVLLFDYGYPRKEFLLPERSDGTLMCYYRHRAHADPFFYPGLQDITAHVDFTSIAEASVQADLELNGYCSQGSFLQVFLNEITSAVADADPQGKGGGDSELQRIKRAQEIKTLTLPGTMGERFQVMGFSRGLDFAMRGFCLEDLSYRL